MRPINQPENHHGPDIFFSKRGGGEKKCDNFPPLLRNLPLSTRLSSVPFTRDEVQEAEFRRSQKSKRGGNGQRGNIGLMVTSTFVI